MAERKHLLCALDILTDGAAARVPRGVGLESVEAMHKEAQPWTMGKGIQGLGIAEKVTDGEKRREIVLKIY